MKYIGIDVGEKRVGVAVSDDAGVVAFPLRILEREECIARITEIIQDRNIDTAVLGKSTDLSGKDNPIMTDIRKIADTLQKKIPVIFEPEQFSTQAAGRLGKGSDAEAATIILQSYLDRCNAGKEEEISFD